MPLKSRKEIGVDLLGLNATNPFFRNNSAPREAMSSTQIGQAPIVDGNEPRRIMTGVELRYSQTTFDIKFPCHATVLKTIRKFQHSMGKDAIRHNPVTTIVYEDYYDPHKTVGIIDVPEFTALHQDFGFRLKKKADTWDRIAPGATFEKGEVIAQSPAVRDNGQYGYGLEAQVAYMSLPGTIEDGFVVSEEFMERMTPTIYNTLVGDWGRKTFPLNLYGDDTTYKPFPDIGERIRDDGLVFALRDVNDDLGVAEMTPRALREVDHTFDRPLYGKPGATVVDIRVVHDDKLNPSYTPIGMDTQARKYYDAQCRYYQALLDTYNELKARRGKRLKITPEFNRLLVEAQIMLPTPPDKRKLTRMYRLETLDEWRVEVTYEYKIKTGVGNKLTDLHGGKGIDCVTLPAEALPVDQNGNRADVVVYGGSTIKRMNMGRLYEHFINAASRDLLHRLRKECGLEPKIRPTAYQVQQLKGKPVIEWCWDKLMGYYEIVAPLHLYLIKDDPDHFRHVSAVLMDEGAYHDGIYLWIPPDNPVNNLEMAKRLRDSEYCPHYGPVTYQNGNGEFVTTKDNVLIGSMYMIMLEKTGEDWSSVASVKTNHFGVAAKLNNFDKNTSPGRQQSVRGLGESETRSDVSVVGPEATMELLDQSNSPETHRVVVENILKAPEPTNIQKVVDRKKVPFGGSRPVAFTEHLLACRGMRLVYKPDTGVTEENTK